VVNFILTGERGMTVCPCNGGDSGRCDVFFFTHRFSGTSDGDDAGDDAAELLDKSCALSSPDLLRGLACFLLGNGDALCGSLLQCMGGLPVASWRLICVCLTGDGSKCGAGDGEKGDDISKGPFSVPRGYSPLRAGTGE
jgi:hypothetical protein